MDGYNRKTEVSEVPQMEDKEKISLGENALGKYDKIMEDDKLEYGDERNIPELNETEREDKYNSLFENEESDSENRENTYDGLTDEEKIKVREETGWSDKITDSMGSMSEYEIYKKAELEERVIGDKESLIRKDIDWNTKWETGKYDENGNPIFETNEDRIKKGRAPLDENGNPIQLHHIGQHADSPLAELTFEEHRCNGNDTILHDKSIETEAHGEGNNWDNERQDYWKNRAEFNEGGYDDV